MPREMRGVPFEAVQIRPKGDVVDLPHKRETRSVAKEARIEHPDAQPATLDTEDQRQADSLNDQLRFLLKRLDIAKDTLSDPSAVKQIDKNYKDLMNEMQKAVVKYDSSMKPKRADIKRSDRAIGETQKKYEQSSGVAKFLRNMFPAMDSTGRELRAMRADLEAKKKDLETREKKRARAASAAGDYNDLINALHQAEAIVTEINILTRKAS